MAEMMLSTHSKAVDGAFPLTATCINSIFDRWTAVVTRRRPAQEGGRLLYLSDARTQRGISPHIHINGWRVPLFISWHKHP